MMLPPSLTQYRPQSLLPLLKAHRKITIAVVALSPFVYYGLKLWLWLRKMKPSWDKLRLIDGPEKHWLYGNLHQVCTCISYVIHLYNNQFTLLLESDLLDTAIIKNIICTSNIL